MEPHNVIIRIVYSNSEKAIRLADRENKIVAIVDRRANKKVIKETFEKLFNVKVIKVNTMITPRGEKKAYIKLDKNYKATDIIQKLKLM